VENKQTVCAVIVTYNRKDLLLECLEAVLKQTYPIDAICLVDNASTDGTQELLRGKGYIKEILIPINEPLEQENIAYMFLEGRKGEGVKIYYVRMNKNTGGAGGFYKGVKTGYEKGYGWLWTMDDDTIPDKKALEELIKASCLVEKGGLFSSHVVWVDGSPHRMNVPIVKRLLPGEDKKLCPFNDFIDKGMIRIFGCSFVSILISRYAIEKTGFPIPEMFIYYDDIEFTQRVCSSLGGYYVVNSRVVHKTLLNQETDISVAPFDELWRYYYDFRNRVFVCKRMGFFTLLAFLIKDVPSALVKILQRKNTRIKALFVFFKGVFLGLFFNPKIKYGSQKKIIKANRSVGS
jgi:GT2 family glycosyltransferase